MKPTCLLQNIICNYNDNILTLIYILEIVLNILMLSNSVYKILLQQSIAATVLFVKQKFNDKHQSLIKPNTIYCSTACYLIPL